MTFEEFDETYTPAKSTCDPCDQITKPVELGNPRGQFIMVGPDGLAYYATTTEDGRVVRIDDDYLGNGLWD